MAIIKCPECGKDVSDQAEVCVHCGYPLAKGKPVSDDPADAPAAPAEEKKEKPAGGRKKGLILAVAGVLLVAAVIAVVLLVTGEKPLQVTMGQSITLGHYPQTAAGNDQTPIEWIVLDVRDGKALVISKYGLDAKPYNTEWVDTTWEHCTLRAWLNDEFLNKAFSAEEQAAILTTEVDNSSAQGFSGWKMDYGNNTQDKVFLLSYAEAHQYFGVEHYSVSGSDQNTAARVAPTEYAIQAGPFIKRDSQTADGKPAGYWWLRSPGTRRSRTAHVDDDGSLGDSPVSAGNYVVRPAFWVNLKSDIF